MIFRHGDALPSTVSTADGQPVMSGYNITLKNKPGREESVVAGYDFGLLRMELEAGSKRVELDHLGVPNAVFQDVLGPMAPPLAVNTANQPGITHTKYAMANLLANFSNKNMGAYIGAGAGVARIRFQFCGASDKETALGLQAIAGAYASVSKRVDLGLRYRYFRSGNLGFTYAIVGEGPMYGHLAGHESSQSLLIGITYHLGART